jgi:hypothetical protein
LRTERFLPFLLHFFVVTGAGAEEVTAAEVGAAAGLLDVTDEDAGGGGATCDDDGAGGGAAWDDAGGGAGLLDDGAG